MVSRAKIKTGREAGADGTQAERAATRDQCVRGERKRQSDKVQKGRRQLREREKRVERRE